MATTIKLKNGSGAPLAGDLVQGEPALDLTNKRLYTEDSGGTVIEVGTNPSTLTVDGNVGIGLTSPAAKLHVDRGASSGAYFYGGSNDRRELIISSGTGDASSLDALHDFNASGASGVLSFSTGSAERLRIDSSGNVGIKTTSPSFPLAGQLHISGGTGYVGLNLQKGSAGTGHLLEFTDENNTLQYRIGTNFASGGQNLLFAYGSTPTIGMTLTTAGNIGIGTASPAGGATRIVDVYGSSSSAINFHNATSGTTATDGGVVGQYGNDLVLFNYEAGIIQLGTSNTERMRIDSSGRVGIGITPSYTLDIQAIASSFNPVRFSGHGSSIDAFLYTDTAYWSIGDTAAYGGNLWGGNKTSNFVHAYTNGSERMRIDSVGKIGVGLSNPSGSFHLTTKDSGGSDVYFVAQNTTASRLAGYKILDESNNVGGKFQYDNGSNNLLIGAETSSNFQFVTNNAERMRIDSSGNLLVGKTAANSATAGVQILPEGDIGITRNGSHSLLLNRLTSDGDIALFRKDGATVGSIGSNNSAGTPVLDISANSTSGIMRMLTSGTERMRIDSSGNLLIGVTTSVGGGSEGIELRGDAGYYKTARYTAGSAGHWLLYNSNGNVGSVTTYSNSTQFNTSSDQRLKENIVDAPAGNIDAIRVRSFDWKTDGSHQKYGMVAQELVDVAPEAVTQGETDDDMWQVDYSKLVPMMIKEIQDLKAEVAALKGA
jgi:hypothetical protein